MICSNPKEVLAEIKKYMDINDIPIKDLADRMETSSQNISKIFNNANPQMKKLFEICEALNLKIDFTFIDTNK